MTIKDWIFVLAISGLGMMTANFIGGVVQIKRAHIGEHEFPSLAGLFIRVFLAALNPILGNGLGADRARGQDLVPPDHRLAPAL